MEKTLDLQSEMNSTIIPIYIELYLTPSKTFIYRQLKEAKDIGEKIVLVSSKPINTDYFPFPKIYWKKKNLLELYPIKFYEKILRDRIFFKYYRFLGPFQKRYFTKILDNPKIKFVHAHFGTGAIEIFKIARNLNKKLLVSFHGYDASNLLQLKSYVNNLKMFFSVSYVITPSQFMLKRLIEKVGEPKKAFVIHYGIPLDFFEYVEREPVSEKFKKGEKITFLQVSNFIEKKGHIYTLQAFADIHKKHKNTELILGGEGELFNKMKKVAEKLGLNKSVKFLGLVNQEQVRNLFKQADVFVHHSVTAKNGDQEGIPNVIMEAMATGLPVISTYHSGIPELVQDGENGFLVSERDVTAYAEKMEFVLKNADKTISLKARKTIEKEFNNEIQVEKIHNVYRYLLNE